MQMFLSISVALLSCVLAVCGCVQAAASLDTDTGLAAGESSLQADRQLGSI